MPVSVVVGGQFGSEGKGKIALELVRRERATTVVRVGGTNSGHTAISRDGKTYALRQLPAACIDRSVKVVIPPGSYIDLEILRAELQLLQLGPSSVRISPWAKIITDEHKAWERASNLNAAIGSTQSGTGAAVIAAIARDAEGFQLKSRDAEHIHELEPFLEDTSALLRKSLKRNERIVIEGSQGFGLSLLHGGFWPKATSRDTTAAGFAAEAGISPLDVDDVTLVIRCHPIRVAGDSGPLVNETDWETIAQDGGLSTSIHEYTTVTKKLRRVGAFDAGLVRRAVEVNRPTRIVLNHLDYVDPLVREGRVTSKARQFVSAVEAGIGEEISWLGTSPAAVLDRKRPAFSVDNRGDL
ncbi:MAG: adenylosuccinate synthetase [Rhodospirillaceae bacterium]